jgi:effector-binding domain-containing protein
MRNQPRIEERPASPYIGIHARVAGEAEFRRAVDRGFPELFGWLGENDVAPAGPPFIRYLELDAHDEPTEIELGVPVASDRPVDGRLQRGVLPAGQYATLLHVGPYNSATVPDLAAARAELLRWADEHDIELDASKADGGTSFRACVEHYITDPRSEPDSSKWQTELAYLTAEN